MSAKTLIRGSLVLLFSVFILCIVATALPKWSVGVIELESNSDKITGLDKNTRLYLGPFSSCMENNAIGVFGIGKICNTVEQEFLQACIDNEDNDNDTKQACHKYNVVRAFTVMMIFSSLIAFVCSLIWYLVLVENRCIMIKGPALNKLRKLSTSFMLLTIALLVVSFGIGYDLFITHQNNMIIRLDKRMKKNTFKLGACLVLCLVSIVFSIIAEVMFRNSSNTIIKENASEGHYNVDMHQPPINYNNQILLENAEMGEPEGGERY